MYGLEELYCDEAVVLPFNAKRPNQIRTKVKTMCPQTAV
jgi:hypothetical protein